MAACGSLAHIFETPSSLPDQISSSWTQIMSLKQTEQHSTFTQIFGKPSSSNAEAFGGRGGGLHRKSNSAFSSSNSDSLQLCTEGLGYESLDDVEDLEGGVEYWQREDNEEEEGEKGIGMKKVPIMRTKSANMEDFPPPISCMAKPWAGFKSYRYGGRFILKEIRVPTHDFLHASRENGRLKLHILVPNDNKTTDKTIAHD